MTTPLSVETVRDNQNNVVVLAAGEIDHSNVDAFKQVIAAGAHQTAEGGLHLTVDLTAVEYLDSAAINVLFAHSEHVDLVVIPSLLMPVLTVSGLTELITTERSPLTARTHSQSTP